MTNGVASGCPAARAERHVASTIPTQAPQLARKRSPAELLVWTGKKPRNHLIMARLDHRGRLKVT
jgi:hypothetical protein